MSEPIVDKKNGISPVWILPILAICLGGWLLFKSYRDAGIDITLQLNESTGITVDKTPVIFKGNRIGIVKEIHVKPDLQAVILTIEMNKDAAPYLVEDLKFWVKNVEVEAGRITGLDTLLSGSYIGVQRGMSTKPCRDFIALDHQPPVPENAPGLHLNLMADTLGSLQIGSGIYHKDIMIGSVQQYALLDDDMVNIEIFIEPEYQHMVKKDSRFWNASGIMISGGISDLKVHIASLATIIKGGILMQTPEALKESPQAENGQTYKLYEDYDAAEYGIPLTLKLENGEGIREGTSKIRFRGMDIGVIKELHINRDSKYSVSAQVMIDPRAEIILREGTSFYLVRPDLSVKGIRNLDTVMTGSYITFIPGEGKFKDHFRVKAENPPLQQKEGDPGDQKIMLTARDLGSVDVGSPILYKKIRVGEITAYRLREKEDDLLLTGLIGKQYAGLVRTTSRFYNTSGVEVNAGLSGVKIQTGTLETIIAGGIAFFTPEKGAAHGKNGGVYTLYDDYEAADNSDRVKITIHFDRSDGLKKGVLVKYHGIEIGKVSNVFYENNMETITVEAMLEEDTISLLKETTGFWIVRPAFNLAGTQHLDTLLGGPYIAIAPGKGEFRTEFTALREEPVIVDEVPGLNIVLEADDLFSLKAGDHVYYRKVVVGEVTGYKLSPTFQKVLLNVIIYEPFIPIIRENTKFWNASGIKISGGVLSGLSVSTESLEGLLAGGIALATPDKDKMGGPVTDGYHFPLLIEAEEKWLEWSPEITPDKTDDASSQNDN